MLHERWPGRPPSRRGLLALLVAVTGLLQAAPDPAAVLPRAAAAGERIWAKVERLDRNLTSRELFGYAFVLAETGRTLDRLPRLLDVAARLQDRDKESQGFGNFRWKWADGTVLDSNAAEFCMQYGALIWIRQRDRLSADLQARLAELLDFAVQGCLRHPVPAGYTNIALMNAGNLILLGEALNRPDVLAEGRTRLDAFCLYSATSGIHEYGSPTYYGVDLECLMLLRQFTTSPPVRVQAETLLELFWEDLTANWYAPGGRLGGAHSRDYDYRRGLGLLDGYLAAAGWLPGEDVTADPPLATALCDWQPAAERLARNQSQYPRWVVQGWGAGPADTRAHWVTPDVALGTAGAAYGGAMDLPLTIDFAQPRQAVRAYFIADGRRDPYGRKAIPAGGGHEKTLHLNPFWAATQDRGEALGLVLYRPQDVPEQPPTLESHLVFAADADEILVGGQALAAEARAGVVEFAPGAVLAVRRGRGAFAVRIPWSRSQEGEAARAAVVFDGTALGACRLTVAHHSLWGAAGDAGLPGAAFWVRVAADLAPASFRSFAAAFAAAEPPEITATAERVRLRVPGPAPALALSVSSPWELCDEREPQLGKPILAVNGSDLGARLLQGLDVVRQRGESLARVVPVAIAPGGVLTWEAEAGSIMPVLTTGKADQAFGGQFVWAPGAPGARGGGEGTLTCRIAVAQAGTYYLWGRVLTPTADDDSFFVRVHTVAGDIVPRGAWHMGTHPEWEWSPVTLEGSPAGSPTPLPLPQGDVLLELSVRENGACIDQFFLTADANRRP